MVLNKHRDTLRSIMRPDKNMIRLNEVEFRQLFDDNYVSLCKYCIRFVRHPEIAEEIVQDQFIYIWNNQNVINIHTSYQAYLYKAVRNKSIDYLRSRFATIDFNNDIEEVDNTKWDDPILKMEEGELKQLIGQALINLPEKCHTIFTLSRFGEMKNNEIAETLNISVKTVENQITIALRKMRSFLEKHWLMLISTILMITKNI